MNCDDVGQEPGGVDCQEVLDRVYVYVDGEMGPTDVAGIRRHLEECGPCLRSVDVEVMLKALVARSCREHAPEQLRQRVLVRLEQVRMEISSVE